MDQDPLVGSKIVLHTCCAPCSAAIIEYLINNNIRPTLFFCNPNIYPLEEYETRKQEIKRYAEALNIPFIDGDYDHQHWLDSVKGLENEPERGLRCLKCFKLRLLTTACFAAQEGCQWIATTLASSRWKSLEQIAEAGDWAVDSVISQSHEPIELKFWSRNWRKGGLSDRRRELLAENNFYNQQYCGCEFSRANRTNK